MMMTPQQGHNKELKEELMVYVRKAEKRAYQKGYKAGRNYQPKSKWHIVYSTGLSPIGKQISEGLKDVSHGQTGLEPIKTQMIMGSFKTLHRLTENITNSKTSK